MFTSEDRRRIRSELLDRATRDSRISGGAVTGSAAEDREDRWSDVDLAFGVEVGADLTGVLSDWTAYMYEEHRAVHHVDMRFGAWTYGVFLLADTLQVDLAFVPEAEFRAVAPSFRLAFGKAQEARHAPPPLAEDLIGMGWLYALHARSSIARGKLWQAEYMVSGVRDHALALACLRHGLPTAHGRGFDQLPAEVTARFEDALVRHLDEAELVRAFGVAMECLLIEIQEADDGLSRRLQPTLVELSSPTR